MRTSVSFDSTYAMSARRRVTVFLSEKKVTLRSFSLKRLPSHFAQKKSPIESTVSIRPRNTGLMSIGATGVGFSTYPYSGLSLPHTML